MLLNAVLSPWCDVKEKTSWTLILFYNVSNSVARSKMTDVTITCFNSCIILAEEQYGFRTNSATEKAIYMLTKF
jgi:hypothetical protein